jgi:hypothetical protein
MTSIEVKALVSAATIAFLFALFLDFRKQKRIRLLVARIKEKENGAWQTLPWLYRAMPRAQAIAQVFGVLTGSLAGTATYVILVPGPAATLITPEWPAPRRGHVESGHRSIATRFFESTRGRAIVDVGRGALWPRTGYLGTNIAAALVPMVAERLSHRSRVCDPRMELDVSFRRVPSWLCHR